MVRDLAQSGAIAVRADTSGGVVVIQSDVYVRETLGENRMTLRVDEMSPLRHTHATLDYFLPLGRVASYRRRISRLARCRGRPAQSARRP